MMKTFKQIILLSLLALFSYAFADSTTVSVYTTDTHQLLGKVIFQDSQYGLLITPDLKQLSPGLHGFHIHQHPMCDNLGEGAGAHLDPQNTGKHLGPYAQGHLGDLPALFVNTDGSATLPILAPRLSVATIKNHSLMIHAGGDNYSDMPEKLGGGGKRIACGVIQ